jgi:cellulose 1,4-beta-cellobiosidase
MFNKIIFFIANIIITNSIILGSKDDSPLINEFKCVLDANWRWIHFNNYENCYDNEWKCKIYECNNCMLEGISKYQYQNIYGITNIESGLSLQFITGTNIGSRVYLLQNNKYWFPELLNHQISIDIDLSKLPCGINSAVYLVNMNTSNLDVFGIGYGDAQCPTDIKYFYDGTININKKQICSVEIDLIEANSESLAWTLHPCNEKGCDKSGADANSYRQGFRDFYGKNKIINTSKPFTVITQFKGDPLYEVIRYYKQDNLTIEHPGGSLTSKSIAYWKKLQNEENTFELYGGFESLTKAIKNGMVVVLSIWDDPVTNMKWLDANDRGPCLSNKENIRELYKNVNVIYNNIKLEIIN